MELVDLPEEWCHGQFASGIAYHIPAFSEDVVTWRRELQQRLEATLGEERSSLLGQEIDEYLRAEWNDLGEGERTVGFVWHPEANGSQSIRYAIKDLRHGAGTFRRHLPGGDTDSSFAHWQNSSAWNCQRHHFELRPRSLLIPICTAIRPALNVELAVSAPQVQKQFYEDVVWAARGSSHVHRFFGDRG
jgi:hypothetical protein